MPNGAKRRTWLLRGDARASEDLLRLAAASPIGRLAKPRVIAPIDPLIGPSIGAPD